MRADDSLLTVDDANQRLPLVRAIVRDAIDLKRDVLQRQSRLQDLRERYPGEGDDGSPYAEEVLQMEESLEADEIRIDGYSHELRQIGATLQDAETGLVEFASSLDGDPVWLSWVYDEPDVSFWRSERDEPANRRPLEPAEQTN